MRGMAWGAVLAIVATAGAGLVWAQSAGAGQATGDTLTPQEQQQLQEAGQAFSAGKYADALAIYKTLHAAHPGDARMAKFAAESAIDTGDGTYAKGILEPMEAVNPDDWQATALLARVYAEAGDGKDRDAQMAHMDELYQKGLIPARLQQYLLEKVTAQGKAIWIWHSLAPWGDFRVYDYARVVDGSGQTLMRITLESSDFDQPLFQKDHPQEAAAGKRLFSLDGYKDEGRTADGGHREMHMTFGFLIGEPTYDEVRTDFLQIATGTWKPVSDLVHSTQ